MDNKFQKGLGKQNRIDKEKLILAQPLQRHLEDDEIDALVSSFPDRIRGPELQSDPRMDDAMRHLESCESCSRKVQMHRQLQGEITHLASPRALERSPDCPGGVDWLHVAAGLKTEAETLELMSHAAQCDHCGPLLRNASASLSDEATPEEELELAGLRSARQDWQREIARRLSRETSPVKQGKGKELQLRKWMWPRRWALGAAIATAVLVFVWLGVLAFRKPSVDQLLAEAYSERRTLEVRIPGAAHAPLRQDRGTDSSFVGRPRPLLKAEEIIAGGVGEHPNDPTWLEAKGRADLLDGNFDAAIQSLGQALQSRPGTPEILVDLASAYFGRAERSKENQDRAAIERNVDYGHSMELLGEALSKNPDDATALFNRAIVSERMFLYTQAVQDWEHYLRIDASGAWSDEARQRLARLCEDLGKREKSLAEPLFSPAKLAALDPADAFYRTEVDQRIEEYLHLAVRDWLPVAYPVVGEGVGNAGDSRRALLFVGRLAKVAHGDPWLLDLLASSAHPRFAQAIEALSQAVRADDAGDHHSAMVRARVAKDLFRASDNVPGKLRARLEEIYALHLSHEGTPCLRAVADDRGEIDSQPYTWIATQFHIEHAICEGLMGNLGGAQRILNQLQEGARKTGYKNLYLRAVGNAAEMEAGVGHASSGWNRTIDGLAFFWATPLPPMQGYNLYWRLYSIAESEHEPFLQVSIWSQALTMVDGDEDLLLRAMAHSTMADAALSARMNKLAGKEFNEARRLFALVPDTEATNNYRIEAETNLATVEARHGNANEALDVLQHLEPAVEQMSNNYVAIQFYTTLADVRMAMNAPSAADSALRSAVLLAELSLASLNSDHDRVTWSEQTAGAYRGLARRQFDEGNPVQALETWEWYRGAAHRAVEQRKEHRNTPAGQFELAIGQEVGKQPTLPNLHGITDQLSSMRGETVIVYMQLSDGLVVWAYDENGIESKWVSTPVAEINSSTVRFRELCANPRSDIGEIRTMARALYDLLVAPVADKLADGKLLAIEPDGSLGRVPMEALVDDDGRYLSERETLLYSFGFYDRTHQRSSSVLSGAASALVATVSVSDVEGGKELPPLANLDVEAAMVVNHFPAARLLQEKQATVAVVRKELHTVSVFHFGGHAIDSAERSGLLLADGVFTVDTLKTDKLESLQLAVLAACDTAGGTTKDSSDYDSLVKGFLRAGVPHVVASRWNVDSATTTVFMKEFYSSLLTGHSVSESVTQSQRSLKRNWATSHPYYWAAFTVFGQH
jgi:CHAT domain-containing protein/tetratricopeptide (TPR) repeat protein